MRPAHLFLRLPATRTSLSSWWEWGSVRGPSSLSCRCSNVPAPKPSTVSSEMKNKVWNVSLKTFVLKGLLKKFKGRWAQVWG